MNYLPKSRIALEAVACCEARKTAWYLEENEHFDHI